MKSQHDAAPNVSKGDTHMENSSTARSTGMRSDRASTTRIPRWVIVFVLIILLLVLGVVIVEITTNGMGNMQMSIPWHQSASVSGGQTR